MLKQDPIKPQERTFEIFGDSHQIQVALNLIKSIVSELPIGQYPNNLPMYGGFVGTNGMMGMNYFQQQPYPTANSSVSYATQPNVFSQNGGGDSIFTQPYANYWAQQQPGLSMIMQGIGAQPMQQQQQQYSTVAGYISQSMPQQVQTTTTAAVQAPIMSTYQVQSQPLATAATVGVIQPPITDYSAQWVKFYRDMGMPDQVRALY